MPIYLGYCYVEHSSLYDSERIRAGTTTLFRYPVGEVDRESYPMERKDYSRTNMQMSSMLPQPQRFLIKRIYCSLRDSSGQLAYLDGPASRLWDGMALRLFIGLRTFVEGPAASFAHPNIAIPRIHKKESRYRYQQWRRRRGHAHDEMIECGQIFWVEIENPNPQPGSMATVSLEGEWTKAVQ